MKIKHIAASIILAVSATSAMAATFSLNGVLCGNSSGLSVDSLGNVSATVSGTNACSNSGNGTPPVVVPPVTPPIDGGAGSTYQISLNQEWGPLSGNIERKVAGTSSWVWKAPTNTIQSGATGMLSTLVTSSGSVHREVAISTLPNDYNVLPECKKASASTTSIKWAMDQKVYGSCELKKGVTYYINVRHVSNGSTTCPSGSGCTFYIENKLF